jgi:hypothetical protein
MGRWAPARVVRLWRTGRVPVLVCRYRGGTSSFDLSAGFAAIYGHLICDLRFAIFCLSFTDYTALHILLFTFNRRDSLALKHRQVLLWTRLIFEI